VYKCVDMDEQQHGGQEMRRKANDDDDAQSWPHGRGERKGKKPRKKKNTEVHERATGEEQSEGQRTEAGTVTGTTLNG
jgi:hypothetical protein